MRRSSYRKSCLLLRDREFGYLIRPGRKVADECFLLLSGTAYLAPQVLVDVNHCKSHQSRGASFETTDVRLQSAMEIMTVRIFFYSSTTPSLLTPSPHLFQTNTGRNLRAHSRHPTRLLRQRSHRTHERLAVRSYRLGMDGHRERRQ